MRIEYDPKHDIMNIELVSNVPIAESIELDDGIIIDYSEGSNVVSIYLHPSPSISTSLQP